MYIRHWSKKYVIMYFTGDVLKFLIRKFLFLAGDIRNNFYEVWNCNSGNYLFTTDTK